MHRTYDFFSSHLFFRMVGVSSNVHYIISSDTIQTLEFTTNFHGKFVNRTHEGFVAPFESLNRTMGP
jgi:hypothetical protein